MSRAATDLAVWQGQAAANARAVAQQLHYDGPLSPDILQQGIVESKARIGSELFAIGARLLLIREQCAHGEFLLRLENLNMDPRAARKYMQVALKFSKTATVAALDGLSLSKLLELAMLDDETLEVLESDGTVLGFKPDDLANMSVRELRSALRSVKENYTAMEQLHGEKVARINALELAGNKKSAAKYTPDQKEQDLRKALSDYELQVTATLDGNMRKSIQDLMAHGEEHDKRYTELLAGHLLHIEASCQALREQFGINRALDDMPAWMANTPVAG